MVLLVSVSKDNNVARVSIGKKLSVVLPSSMSFRKQITYYYPTVKRPSSLYDERYKKMKIDENSC